MDAIDQFSVLFSGDRVFIEETSYPTGQLAVDVLNLDDGTLIGLVQQLLELAHALKKMLEEDSVQAITETRQLLQTSLKLVAALPVFRDLNMNLEQYDRAFIGLPESGELWAQILIPDSAARDSFEEMISRLLMIPERLRLFRNLIFHMTKGYIDTMPRRNAAAYADAFLLFYGDMLKADEESGAPFGFDQSFPLEVDFVPMIDPTADDGSTIIAERTRFKDVVDFLLVEFYRGLILGNAPRRCHNCGRYFLLTKGYNTCYCNNIAPGETERTCRKVGAHRKEAQGRANRTPAKVEYDKAYLRLKQRKLRGKISVDEWNTAVAKAQELLEQSEQGKLTDEELTQKLKVL